jgi:hypothetical protein
MMTRIGFRPFVSVIAAGGQFATRTIVRSTPPGETRSRSEEKTLNIPNGRLMALAG